MRRVGSAQRNPPFVTARWRNDWLVAIKAAPARPSALGLGEGGGIGGLGTHPEHPRIADGIQHLGQRLLGGLAIPFAQGGRIKSRKRFLDHQHLGGLVVAKVLAGPLETALDLRLVGPVEQGRGSRGVFGLDGARAVPAARPCGAVPDRSAPRQSRSRWRWHPCRQWRRPVVPRGHRSAAPAGGGVGVSLRLTAQASSRVRASKPGRMVILFSLFVYGAAITPRSGFRSRYFRCDG